LPRDGQAIGKGVTPVVAGCPWLCAQDEHSGAVRKCMVEREQSAARDLGFSIGTDCIASPLHCVVRPRAKRHSLHGATAINRKNQHARVGRGSATEKRAIR
jgi:hypothetical protein